MKFLDEFYDIEHLQSIDDAVDDLILVCKRNGGELVWYYITEQIYFQIIEIEKSNPYKEFGRGFYLTDIFSQAENMANKKARILGGIPIVQKYNFEESALSDNNLRVLILKNRQKNGLNLYIVIGVVPILHFLMTMIL